MGVDKRNAEAHREPEYAEAHSKLLKHLLVQQIAVIKLPNR